MSPKSRPILRAALFCFLLLPLLTAAEPKPNLSSKAEFIRQLDLMGPDWSPVDGMTTSAPEIVPPGKTFLSPDRRFSAQLGLVGYEWSFAITDRKTGTTSHCPSEHGPLFSVGWTSDSRSIVVVAHAAHTSFIRLLHWDGHLWKTREMDYPIPAYNAHIVSWEFRQGSLWVTSIGDEREKNEFTGFHQCLFQADPTTGRVSNAQKTPLTRAQYLRLRTPQN